MALDMTLLIMNMVMVRLLVVHPTIAIVGPRSAAVLSDRVPVVVAVVVFWLHLEGRTCWQCSW